MAQSRFEDEDIADQIPETANALNLPVFKFDPGKPDDIGNLAGKLDKSERMSIGERMAELVDIDEKSYTDEWLRDSDTYLDLVLRNEAPFDEATQEETAAEETHSRPSFGVIIGAMLQYNGKALDAIMGTPDLVKTTKDDDPSSVNLAKWASQILRMDDKNWVVDTDLLTLHYSVTGLGWRKRWVNRASKKMKSTFLTCKEVIVNKCSPLDITRVPRITHCLEYYPHEIVPMIANKEFCRFDFSRNDDDPSAPIKFREVHLWLDMNGDGIEEPWTLTFLNEEHKEVVSLYPRWCAPGALKVGEGNDTIWTFKPNIHFTPYHFIPNPKGYFHSLGYGWLLRKFEEASSHLLNDALGIVEKNAADGGVAQGGTAGIPETVELRRDRLTMLPSDDGRSIQERVQMFPSKPMPEAVPKIIEMLLSTADRLTGSTSMLSEAPADMTATLAQGLLQGNAAVNSATHRRFLEAMTNEVRAMSDLALAHGIGPEGVTGADTDSLGLTTDPALATETARATLGAYYGQFLQDPVTNPVELRLRMHQIMRAPNPQALIVPPQAPQPTPDAKLKFAQDMVKHLTGRTEGDARAANDFAQALMNLAKAGQEFQTLIAAIPLMQQAVDGDPSAQNATGADAGGSPGMAPQPGNGGPPQLPGGQGGGAAGAMGDGSSGLGSAGGGPSLPAPPQSPAGQ